MAGILAGTRDMAIRAGGAALDFAINNPGKAAIGAAGAGAAGYLAYKSMFPGYQPPVDQTQATQIQLSQSRGQGVDPTPQKPGGFQSTQTTPDQAKDWQQGNQIPYIDTQALMKEQLRLYKEKENLRNDLALNQLYSAAAQNPGVLR